MFTITAILCVLAVVVAVLWPRTELPVTMGSAISPAPVAATGGHTLSPRSGVTAVAMALPDSHPSPTDTAWHKAEQVLVLAEEIAGRFGAKPNWQASRDERLLDLALLIHEGLDRVSLDLFTRGKKILVRYLFFTESQGEVGPDIFHDYELPLLENARLEAARLSIPSSVIEKNRDRLRTLPEPDLELTDRTQEAFPCNHVAHRTDGLLHGEIRVGLQPRRRAVVLGIAADGRSARAEVGGLPVFLHQSHLRSGDRRARKAFGADCRAVSCVVVQTPLGFQGRCIRVLESQRRRDERP